MERLFNWLSVHPDNPLRRFMIGYYAVGLVGVAVAIGLQIADVDWVYIFLAALVAATIPVVLPIVAFVTMPYVRNVRGIRRGDHLAHWQYSSDEWARFSRHVERESWGLMRLLPVFGGAVGLVMGEIAWLASRDIATALLFGILLGVGLLVSVQYWFEGRSQRAVRGDVYINAHGVLRPQGYLPISGFNVSLVDISVEPAPTGVTVMRFKVGSLTEHLVTRVQEFAIPVPDGREEEAAALARRLLPNASPHVGSIGVSGAIAGGARGVSR